MGSVVGERFVRGVETAIEQKVPFICFTATGGARMQEGLLSLMQMAKTSAALARLRAANVPYISVLLNPTTGGVAASFAMLGDLIVAEPKALIGFAGPRVIEQTIRQKLPEGFQRSEFLLEHGMIEPFEDRQVREGVVSYGLSSYGYDIRVADEFKVFTNIYSTVVDPKAFDERSFVDIEADVCIIPPNSFALARTVEYFRIPRNVLTICLGKSTYARCGIIVNVTPFEPEWEGFVTLEISNTTPLPAKIYANEGAAQFLFLQGDEPCEISYRDKAGKYQGQRGVTLPKI